MRPDRERLVEFSSSFAGSQQNARYGGKTLAFLAQGLPLSTGSVWRTGGSPPPLDSGLVFCQAVLRAQ